MWRIWLYAIGSFSDEKTKPYDNKVGLIRTFWICLHITTCFAIIIGNGRTMGFW